MFCLMKQIVNFFKESIGDFKEDRGGFRQAVKISFISGGISGFIMGLVGYIIHQYLGC